MRKKEGGGERDEKDREREKIVCDNFPPKVGPDLLSLPAHLFSATVNVK